MGKCVIIGAADIKDYARAKNYLRKDDFYIFCDAGLKHTEALGMKPDLIIGDFDSFSKEEALKQGIETIVLPCEKDDTDTVFASARPGTTGKTITTERMNPFPTSDRWPQQRANS